MNLRNSVISIIDFRILCDENRDNRITDKCKIIVFNYKDLYKIGFIIDEIHKIVDREDIEVQKPESLKNCSFIKGIIEDSGRLISIVDFEHVTDSLEKSCISQ